MSTTQPIRKAEEINALKNYFLHEKRNLRNYALVCLGINSALRISDLLSLTWDDVYDFTNGRFQKHITIIESKTGKQTNNALNQNATQALILYKNSLPDVNGASFLFPGQKAGKALSRFQAYRILNSAGRELHLEAALSCHSLRKTFGYHAWKMGTPTALIMNIYNHSSIEITKRYLSIYQDDKDALYKSMNL